MNREDIQKLLGGYGTGTLTPEEQRALFAAALEDQELFDALGREQALRDLLRDPAAKAELLAALDTPARERGGFWAWLRRPLAVGFAAAAVAAIAIVTVWQGTRGKPAAPPPAIVAELRAPELKATELNAKEIAPPESKRQEAIETTARETPPNTPPKTPPNTPPDTPPNNPARRKSELAWLRDATDKKQETSTKELWPPVAAPLPRPARPPLPAPAAPADSVAPGQPASTTQSVTVTAEASSLDGNKPAAAGSTQTVRVTSLQEQLSMGFGSDARTLFYGNSFVPRPNALVEPLAAGGQQQSAPRSAGATMGAATGNPARQGSTTSNLGVRVSILRGDEEAAVTTILNTGESVRLKLTPNEDGFLYVATRDGNVWKMVASGPVQRLKPFETPPLPYAGSGTRQVYVMLSRRAQTLSPQALQGMAGANLVETLADQDHATYVVAARATDAPQQIVQPIGLTYR